MGNLDLKARGESLKKYRTSLKKSQKSQKVTEILLHFFGFKNLNSFSLIDSLLYSVPKKIHPRFSRVRVFSRFSEKSNGHAQKILLLLSSQTGYRLLLHRSFFWRRSSRFFKNSRTEKCNWGWIFCIIAKFQNKNKFFSCFYQRLRIPYEKHFITQR